MSVHAVIDLETTSLDPANGRILSIGVACQEIDKGGKAHGEVATVEIPVMADDIINHMDQDDPDTMTWWYELEGSGDKGVTAYAMAHYPGKQIHIEDALHRLNEFMKENKVRYVYGNGPDFDIAFLSRYYNLCGIEKKWYFYHVRDVRTLLHAAGIDKRKVPFPEHLCPHVAHHDAMHELDLVVQAWATLRGGGKDA